MSLVQGGFFPGGTFWRCASHAAGQETAPRLTRTGPLAATAVGAATITGAVVMAVASDPPAVSVVRVIMMLAAIVGLGDRDSFLAYRRSSCDASCLAEAIFAC